MAVQLDQSQNHLAKGPEALCTANMCVQQGRGNVQQKTPRPHIRATTWPHHPLLRDVRQYNCLPDKSCEICKKDVAAATADGTLLTLQVVGWKGIDVMLRERFMSTQGHADEKRARLGECRDFKSELSKVQRILADAGHVGFFGAICHCELAHIERKWARIKSYIKPQIDDTRATLLRLMEESFSRQTVLEVQKDARACRETMHAYRLLRQVKDVVTPDDVKEAVAVQKSHRCEIANESGVLKMLANREMSIAEKKAAAALLTRRKNRVESEQAALAAAKKQRLKRKSQQNRKYSAAKRAKN